MFPIKQIVVFSLFSFLSLVVTYPLIFNLGGLTTGYGDELLIAYVHNWVIHILTTNPLHLFEANIYYPYSHTLAYSDMYVTTSILSAISVILTKQPIAAVNTIIILSFMSVGFSTYLLSYHLTKKYLPAILSGVLVIFSPVYIEKVTNIQVLFLPLVPLAILCFLKYLEHKRVFYAVLLSLMFILQMYVSFLPGYFILFSCLSIVGFEVYQKRLVLTELVTKKMILLFITTLILCLPVVIPYYQVSKEFSYVRDIRDSIHFALQPEDLLYPNTYTRLAPLLKHIFPPPVDAPVGEVKSGYLGIVFTLLTLYTLYYLIKQRKKAPRFLIPLGVVALFGLTLSLGPFLHIGRHTIHEPFPVPLPYLVTYYLIPGFQGLRNSARFEYLFILAIAPYIAIVLSQKLKNVSTKIRYLFYGACFSIILLETNVPMHFESMVQRKDFPKIYNAVALLPQDAVIIEMPIFTWNMQPYVFSENLREYYSTVHFRKMVNGASGFSPQPWQDMVSDYLYHFPHTDTILDMKKKKIQYIVVHTKEYDTLAKRRFPRDGEVVPSGSQIILELKTSSLVRFIKQEGDDYLFEIL